MQEESRNSFFFNYFVPRRNYFVTPVIFYLNLLLFLAVSFYDGNFMLPSGETVLLFGGDTPSLTLGGEPWRIVTACFLHFGILHFASNMFALIQLGKIIEDFVGSLRLVLAYLFCGIAGGFVSNWWYSSTVLGVSAGASGAIFGLLGFFLALVTTEFVRKEVRWQMIKSIGGTVLLNLALSTFAEFNNAAHLGGLFAGVISGYLVWVIYKIIPRYKEIVFVLSLSCAIISLFIFVLPKIPKTSILLMALSERIELLKRETTIQIDKELRKNQFEEKDTTFYIQKWNAVLIKVDSLKLFEKNELIDEYFVLQTKDINLRKRKTSLQISVNSGNKTKIIPLKKVQEQLQAMSNPQ